MTVPLASTSARSPAIFIDKDGTLIENIPYNADTAKIQLLPGAVNGLLRLREAGFRLFVISNQTGIALGLLTESQVLQAYACIVDLIAEEAGRHGKDLLDSFYYCPHAQDECDCRKPAPGMLLRAAREHGVPLAHSWMIGDILDDIEAGHRAGCRAILIDNGNETQWEPGPMRLPDAVVARLDEAAALIPPPSHQRRHNR